MTISIRGDCMKRYPEEESPGMNDATQYVTSPRKEMKNCGNRRKIAIAFGVIFVILGALFSQGALIFSMFSLSHHKDLRFFNVNIESSSRVRGLGYLPSPQYQKGGPAIVTLVTNLEKDISELLTALGSLAFLHGDDPEYPAPVLVFNEGNLKRDQVKTIVESTNRPVAFPVVDFSSFPENFDTSEQPEIMSRKEGRSKWGYHQMIRFWVSQLWHHSAIENFDTVMRIDSDSCFKSVNNHLPNFALDHLWYHSEFVGYEAGGERYVEGLYDFVHKYMEKNSIKPKNPLLWQFITEAWESKKSLPVFKTNFELLQKSFMQEKDVAKFHEALTEKEPFGIFRHRWGDAVIRFFTAALFARDEMVMNSPVEGYYHKEECESLAVKNALLSQNLIRPNF